jgi:hypothetical protein
MSWKDSLVVGKQELPPRICVYGGHGVGKSTLASMFPRPIFISTEDGLSSLDVTSFPRAETIDDVANSIGVLVKEEHEFKTVVVDSIDWLISPLIVSDIDSKHDEKAQAYGKGQMMIAESFREILGGLDILRKRRRMNVVLIAHAAVVKFESPITEAYDRYQPKVPNRCNDLMMEWVDVLAYAGFRVLVKKDDAGYGNKTTRGITTGERLLHLVENPAYLAKNRYACPETIPMTYEAFSKVVPVQQ